MVTGKSGPKTVELALWLLAAVVVGAFLGRAFTQHELQPLLYQGDSELRRLAAAYGPTTHSEGGEEWILRDYFQGKRGGVFVDVGANDYEHFSNTFYLETELGWSGLAIEPQTKFAAGYRAHRPRTRFLSFFVSDVSDRTAALYIPAADDMAARATPPGRPSTTIQAPTIMLDDALRQSGIERIDFLSMDIEEAEVKALAGFSIDRFRPALACIEAQIPVRQAILEYFAAHRYRLVAKYLHADEQNLWFEPAPDVSKN